MKSLDHDKVQRNLKHQGIDWIYNAPPASAHGGACEYCIFGLLIIEIMHFRTFGEFYHF